MCCVKTGDDIKCVQDVQNLITGVILRQRHSFNREYLLKATKFYMPQDEKVAASIASDDDISEMIDETLAILHSNGFVVCIDGKYHNARSLLYKYMNCHIWQKYKEDYIYESLQGS